jgi:hypothetical protein
VGLRHLLLVPAASGLLLAGCGGSGTVDEAVNATPVAVPNVAITQTGDSDITIPTDQVTFGLDASQLLVVDLHLRSAAAAPRTVAVRATVYDRSGRIVGDATGATIEVQPGVDTPIELSGPTPNGTIASATLEVHTVPSPAFTATASS